MSKKLKKRNKSMQNMNPDTIENIIQDLIKIGDKRQVANKYGMELGNLYSIYNKNKDRILREQEMLRISKLKSDLNQESVESIAKEVITPVEYTPIIQEETEPVKKTHKRLTDDEVYEIYQETQSGEYSQQQIAELYDISYSTVNRIANGKHRALQLRNIEPKDSDVDEAINTPIVSLDNDIITLPVIEVDKSDEDFENLLNERTPVVNYVRMGMVADRHNMPTNKYVFNTMDGNLMFDYDRQYEIAKTNILKHVGLDSDGNPKTGLFIYVTGLTCALTSIIKVCQDLKIDLILLHYNNSTKLYEQQRATTYGSDVNIMPEEFEPLNFRELYTLGCTTDEFINNGGGWEVSECFFEDVPENDASLDSLGNLITKRSYRDLVLFTDKSRAWEYYIALVEHNNMKNNIYFSSIAIENGKYYKTKTISKSIETY